MIKKTTFIGDTHGKFNDLNRIIKCLPNNRIIQIGDLGIGFAGYPYTASFPANFSFIRGNHDNPQKCKEHPNYIGEYGTKDEFFYISGAFSIDKDSRTQGIDYWDNEELSHLQLIECVELFTKKKSQFVFSHDCPLSIKYELGFFGFDTRTQYAMQQMFECHQPELWIFGHYHISRKLEINGTKFVCLNELETYTI